MLRKFGKLSVLGGLLSVLGLVAGYQVWQNAKFAQRQTLPDGSTLQLRGVTTEPHELLFGTLLERMLDRVLPQWVMIPTGARLVQFPSFIPAGSPALDTNALVLWLDFDPAPEHPDFIFRAVALDGNAPMEATRGFPYRHAPGLPLEVFPRHRREFKVRVFEQKLVGVATWEPIAEFNVSNPKPIQPAIWPTETFPVIRKFDEWEIRVLEIGTKNWEEEGESMRLNRGLCTFVRLSTVRGDLPSCAWAPISISVADASGNSFTNALLPHWDPPVWKRQGNQILVWFPGTLSASAPAWRIQLTLARQGDFRPIETWTIRNMRLPKPGNCVVIDLVTNLAGGTLRFLGMAGLGTPCDLRRTLHWDHLFFQGVHAAFTPARPNTQLTSLKITDAAGLSFPEEANTFPITGGTHEDVSDFMMRLLDEIGPVDLTFGIGEVQTLEFTIRPMPPRVISSQ